ncbi:hypothetical protein MLD38_019615 [Melastoma candidum]|uniref:Uncharacterized protein n=1 Tax=Melastoma candidum TaxID=119954 RepID=A0ACB9QYV1_9MYRT|nr:hypothetical protein MLD38_019615 [Melastoma candidum]
MFPHGGTALRPAFDILDADGDGRISQEDLSSFYAGLPGDAIIDEEDVVGTMISLADEDQDGYVGYEEFVRVVVAEQGRGQGGGGGGVMGDVFRMMDVDGDGKLSREDVAGFMRSAGFCPRDEDVEAMVMLGAGGVVTYDSFMKILGIDDLF